MLQKTVASADADTSASLRQQPNSIPTKSSCVDDLPEILVVPSKFCRLGFFGFAE